RLYAFGIDAYRVAQQLAGGGDKRAPIDGVTGKLTLEGARFNRALTPAEVDGGRVIPLRAP
ncbi:MAG TPA: hypothetical protein VHP55_12225, partial [Usitatibacter sp.]|nr:hypothetical protein [Usitatibacter sp.]